MLKLLLICSAIFVSTCASSQEQPVEKAARISKAEGKKEQGGSKGHEAKSTNQSSAPLVPPVVAKVPSNIEQPVTQAKPEGEQKNEREEEDWWAKLIADPIALFTCLLFFATLALWWTTRKLVLGAEDTATRQLRAYVSVKLDGKMFYGADGCLNAPFITKNNGVTPTNEMRCSFFIGLFRFPLDVELDPPVFSPTSSNAALFPGEQVRQYATLPAKLNQSELAVIKKGEAAIYVWGEVRYTDAFNKERSTKFRLYSTGDDFDRGELAYHHEGNTAK